MVVRSLISGLVGTTALVLVLSIQSPAHAQSNTKEAQIVIDAQTNEVLYESNAQAARRPASITKVMTLYLLFDALEKGEISWDDRIVFSRNAANQPPTKLFVGAGNSISVQTAVEALVLRSANDVATAVAERLGGSESNFAQRMTNKARELGMSSTTFRNASGLPNATQRTTAEDLARLAIAIHRDFPDQYHWFSAQQMSYNGQSISGHNHLMKRVPGMDGLKTGYTAASGFNLAATTQRSGRRIVTVVLGGANRFQRDDLVEALTESAFQELGIGATQFAYNTTSYEVNFRDARDAADAAALFMDLPPRSVTMGGLSTIAMVRSGRRLGFERGSPTFQVADMTRRSDATRVISGRGAQIPQREDFETSLTDDGEEEVVRAPPTQQSAPTAVPVPFRVAIAPSARPMPAPVRVIPKPVPVPVPVPASVPTLFASTVPATRSLPAVVPLRQMAQLGEPQPALVPAPDAKPALVPAATGVVPTPAATLALRGSLDIVPTPPPAAAPPQTRSPQAQPTQMAELLLPTPPADEIAVAPQVEQPSVQPPIDVVDVAQVTPKPPAPIAEQPLVAQPTQMAQLDQREAQAPSQSAPIETPASAELNGTINLAEANPTTPLSPAPVQSQTAPATQTTEGLPVQMATVNPNAIAQAQQRQAEANAREQTRVAQAQAVENTRREALRVQAAAAARVLVERRANEQRAARQLAETRAKALAEKEARDRGLAERLAVQERAVAAREEERRQAEATRARTARGTSVVQVGAFKDRKDANAAIERFSRYFPSFAQTEVTAVTRRDGIWYRARFAGVGASAAGEACRLVLGRGGVCEIVGR